MAHDRWRGAPMRAYVWDRCLLLQAATLVVDRRQKPYKRLSATIIVGGRRPFVLEVDDHPAREYEGVLIAPNVERKYIEAVDCDVTLLDAGITTGAYRDLQPCLRGERARALAADEIERVRPALVAAFASPLSCPQAMRLFDDAVHAIARTRADPVERDARIDRVMELIERRSFDAVSVSMLAGEVGLSESRLRDLFRKSLGCKLSQYMRWVAAWKAVSLWREGTRFTDVAHAAGFHDLAHADHAFTEIFGLSPSQMTDARWMTLHKCGP